MLKSIISYLLSHHVNMVVTKMNLASLVQQTIHNKKNRRAHRNSGGTHEFHGKGELVIEQLQDIVHTLLSRVWEAPVSTSNI